MSQVLPEPTATSTPSTSRAFIAELHGLRGVALTLVVLFHLFTDRVSGGIDIFLFLTGFLITRTMVSQIRAGTLRPLRFLHRLVWRLVPSMAIVVVGVAIGVMAFFGQADWPDAASDLWAALLFYENWALIADNAEYAPVGHGVSPVQHYWSLAVQGQFYVVWLVLVGGPVWLAHRLGGSVRAAAAVSVGGIGVGSFAAALLMVAENQPVAYLHTAPRLWEFALGGLLALWMGTGDRFAGLGSTARGALTWAGLAMVVSCGLVFDAGATFPGYQALWPLVGTTLVLLSGTTGAVWGADRLLRTRAAHFLGDISFALYLWHWPVLVFVVEVTDPNVGWLAGSAVLAISGVLAWATTYVVDRYAPPGRATRADHRRGWVVVTATILPAALVLSGWQAWIATERAEAARASVADYPGAMAMPTDRSELTVAGYRPTLLELAGEPRPTPGGCVNNFQDERVHVVYQCEYGAPIDDAERVIVTVGASHIAQWLPPLRTIAEKRHWALIHLQKGGCNLGIHKAGAETPCAGWNRNAMKLIRALEPDLVISLASTTKGSYGDPFDRVREHVPDEFVDAWRVLTEAGIGVLTVRDNPVLVSHPPNCLARTDDDYAACDNPREEVLPLLSPYRARTDVPAAVQHFDPTERMCTERTCPILVGNVIVQRDRTHVTSRFAETTTPLWAEAVESALATRDALGGHLRAADQPATPHPGAMALPTNESQLTADGFRPTLAELAKQPRPTPRGCVNNFQDERVHRVYRCEYGASPADAERVIVTVGASHIAQWLPALRQIAEERDWALLHLQKGGCNLGTYATTVNPCTGWNRNVMRVLRRLDPDLVISLATTTKGTYGDPFDRRPERVPDDFVDAWRMLTDAGTPVLTVRDTPVLVKHPQGCLARAGNNPSACDNPRAEVLAVVSPFEDRDDIPAGVHHFDPTERMCTARTCPVLVGNVIVQRDRTHLTPLFAETAEPLWTDAIDDALASGVG